MRVFGTIFVSTTRIHGVHLIAAKYSAAALISSSRHGLGQIDHRVRVRLPRIGGVPQAVAEVLDLADEVRHRQPRRRRVFRPSLAVRQMARAAAAACSCQLRRTVRDDIRHRRVIAGNQSMTFWPSRTSTSEYVRAAAVHAARPRLLGRILVGPQIPGRRRLRLRLVAGLRRLEEPVRPERLLLEIDRRDVDAGALGRARLGLGPRRRPGPAAGRAGRRDSYTRCATMPSTKHMTPTKATPARPTRCFTDASSTSLQDDVTL